MEKDDIEVTKATNPYTGEKYAIAHSVKEYHRMYMISLVLLVATVVLGALLVVAIWKFLPFLMKLDTGQWLTRLVLTCRECAPCG